MSAYITDVKGFELIDSRGNPTAAAFVCLSDGSKGFAVCPSGASTGKYEAKELRDKENSRYFGKGVTEAVGNINRTVRDALLKNKIFSPFEADMIMLKTDKSDNKENLGANAVLPVSMAAAKAFAASYKMPLYEYLGGENARVLPRPMMNILNGGAHAGNNLDVQEFMIVPNVGSFAENLRAGCEIYHTLGKLLAERGYGTGVGDEGGFAPDLKNEEEALEIICEAITSAGYSTGETGIALDIASSEWAKDGDYFMPKKREFTTSDELISRYESWINGYPIVSVEDGLGEDDIEGWKKLTSRLGDKIMLVGDDLFVTNKNRLADGIKNNIANSVLVKPNQTGTVSETLEVVRLALKNGYSPIISHRSGDTEDTFISDLSVSLNAPFIKSGAPSRGERTSKYNRLLIIEKEI